MHTDTLKTEACPLTLTEPDGSAWNSRKPFKSVSSKLRRRSTHCTSVSVGDGKLAGASVIAKAVAIRKQRAIIVVSVRG